MLRIPSEEDATPLLKIDRSARIEQGGIGPDSHSRKKRKRQPGEHEWDQRQGGAGNGTASSPHAKWWLTGGAAVLVAVVALVVVTMNRKPERPHGVDAPASSTVSPGPAKTEPSTVPAVDAAPPMRSDVVFLKDAEPLVRRFMSATSVDELLPLVRNPGAVEAKMRAFHKGGTLAPFGYSKIGGNDGVLTRGGFRTVVVVNRDFEEKTIDFEESADGIKIDWESWVGWSEVPWKEFMEAKGKTACLFRVVLREGSYYNFGFADESKWRCYKLESPDGESSLYGYVERGSLLASELQLSPDEPMSRLILRLKFPESATSPNQVIIDSKVADGWAIPSEPKP